MLPCAHCRCVNVMTSSLAALSAPLPAAQPASSPRFAALLLWRRTVVVLPCTVCKLQYHGHMSHSGCTTTAAAPHVVQAAAPPEPGEQPFDHFLGSDKGAFAYGEYDQDDKEADAVYAAVEDTMDQRRKVRPHSKLGRPFP